MENFWIFPLAEVFRKDSLSALSGCQMCAHFQPFPLSAATHGARSAPPFRPSNSAVPPTELASCAPETQPLRGINSKYQWNL